MAAPTVLLVQPNDDNLSLYADYFRFKGFSVMTVPTAREALTLAPHADVVVTGLMLPGGMDGFGFITRLREGERTRTIPIVVVTARALTTDRDNALRAGCDVFLTKPCLPEDLVAAIQRALGRRPRHSPLPPPDDAGKKRRRNQRD